MKAKASLPLKRAEKVLAALELQKLEKERVLQESLSQAERHRQERLTEASLAAGKHFQQVIERAKQMKEKEKLHAEAKIREYHQRQEAAAEARRKLSENNIKTQSLLTTALSQKKESSSSFKKYETSHWNKNNEGKGRNPSSRRRVLASRMDFDEALNQFYESGIPHMIPRELYNQKNLRNSLSELSESLSSMDSGKAPVPMLHQVSVAIDGDESEKTMPFDRFAELIADSKILKCVQRILSEVQSIHEREIGSKRQLPRYPSRIFLAAYMITNYPEVVLSGIGAQETKLTDSAINMILTFDEMIRDGAYEDKVVLASEMVETFDSVWMLYHDQFRVWKSHDAAGLEADLIKAAVELEISRLSKLFQATEKVRHQVDIEALSQGVDHDLQLIEERIETLTGDAGVVRLKAALEAIKSEIQRVDEELASNFKATDIPASTHASPLRKLQRRLNENSSDSSDNESSHQTPAKEWDNLSLMWNLLYDPHWRLPMDDLEIQWEDAIGKSSPLSETESQESPEQTGILNLRIAEVRKWMQLENDLLDTKNTARFSITMQLISEIIDKLKSFAPTLVAEEFLKHFGSQATMKEYLAPNMLVQSPLEWINLDHLLECIEWCSKIIMQLCAPSRDEDILQARTLISNKMKESMLQKDCVASITKAVVRSLRILQIQTKILSMDLANAHLQAMTSRLSRLTPALRVTYARKKLGDELGLPEKNFNEAEAIESMKSSLSKTRGWLAVASGKLPRLSSFNPNLSSNLSPHSYTVQNVPKMKTGFDTSHNYDDIMSAGAESQCIPLKEIHSIASWRGLVRVGLVHLISGDGVIGSLSVPETLTRDFHRLFEMKNEFQKCVIIAMCMIVMENSYNHDKGISLESLRNQKIAAKRRIQAILRDPNVSLRDLSLELSSSIQSLNPDIESFENLSSHIFNIMKALLHRSSQEGRGITEHLNDMLLSLLTILGAADSRHIMENIRTQCDRIGAPEIADEMLQLGVQLGRLAAVTEAVCAPWYESLSEEFLIHQ